MLDWLKTILGDAYSDEIDKKVSEEIGKGFVLRADFNTVNTEKKQLAESLKERDGQLAALKTGTGDAEELKNQIVALQKQNSEQAKLHAEEIERLKIENAVDAALTAAKAKIPKAVKGLLELDKAELAEDGTVKGLDEQLKKLTEAPDSSILFDTGKQQATLKGLKPAEGGNLATGGGKAAKDMSYDELCAFLAENPGAALE